MKLLAHEDADGSSDNSSKLLYEREPTSRSNHSRSFFLGASLHQNPFRQGPFTFLRRSTLSLARARQARAVVACVGVAIDDSTRFLPFRLA